MNALKHQSRKVLVGVVGGLIVLVGLVMIPYPGPGWLVVFAGLAVLATEFERAARVQTFAKERYEAWKRWLLKQTIFVRVCVLSLTGIVVIATLWFLNAFGLSANIVGLDIPLLESPLFRN